MACGKCGEGGHNRRKCPQLLTPEKPLVKKSEPAKESHAPRLKEEPPRKRYPIKRAKVSVGHPVGKEPHLSHYLDKEADHRRFGVRDKQTGRDVDIWIYPDDEVLLRLLPKRIIEKLEWFDEVSLTHYIVWRMA